MGNYKVNWTQLTDGAGTVSTAVGSMESTLADINSQMNALIGTWDAESKEVYLARQQAWNDAAGNIRSALERFKLGLSNSADLSSGAEKTNVNLVAG